MKQVYFTGMMLMPLLLFYACAPVTPVVHRQDALLDRIIQSSSGQTVTFDRMVMDVMNTDIIYLSEKHDNPHHHRIQARIIRDLMDQGRPPSVGFEFFAMAHTPLLLSFVDSGNAPHRPSDLARMEKIIRRKLGWEDQSDTLWGYYFDLLNLARSSGLTVAGLDLTDAQKKRLTRKGFSGVTALERKQLFLTPDPGTVYREYMYDIFKNVHCGMDHPGMQSRLYDTWRARNDRMALSIVQMAETGGDTPVVVIMGGGHTEYALGVMDRVKAIRPDLTQVNIAMTEITRNPSSLSQYLTPLSLSGYPALPPADYLWLTPRVSYEDPCERFREMFEKHRRSTGQDE